jgi:ribosomal protein L37AE/L43A
MFENQEWGKWECPACGETHEDPESICVTTCGECGLMVVLSPTDESGKRDAWEEGGST